MHRFFIDTNVILDFFLARKPHADAAARLLDAGLAHRCEVHTSAVSFCNVAYILHRLEKKRRIEKDLELLLNCVKIAPNDASQLGQALHVPGPDYEDAIQYTSALATQCTHLVTSNIKHFRHSRIPVIDASEAVRLLLCSADA